MVLLWRADQQNHGHGTSKVQTLTVDLTFRESLVPWLGAWPGWDTFETLTDEKINSGCTKIL